MPGSSIRTIAVLDGRLPQIVFAILDPTLVSKAGPRFEGRKD
jgi:hypothetical protein